MHTLFTRPETGGFAVHAALEQSGTQYGLVTIDKSKEDTDDTEFRRLNPLGQVPVLKLPDGMAMTESAAMMIYLGDLAPDNGLAPAPTSPLRPHYLRWMVFCATNLYMTDLRIYYADRYTSDPSGAKAVASAAHAEFDAQMGILDDALANAPFLLGDQWSGADIYATMIAHWHPDVPGLFAARPNLARMCQAVSEFACVKAANSYHRSF